MIWSSDHKGCVTATRYQVHRRWAMQPGWLQGRMSGKLLLIRQRTFKALHSRSIAMSAMAG